MEDVDDLVEPVGDITRFDECLFTVGARERPGYAYQDRHGTPASRSALAFDLGGGLPEMDLVALPGEEPPQIECHEHAGGQGTQE